MSNTFKEHMNGKATPRTYAIVGGVIVAAALIGWAVVAWAKPEATFCPTVISGPAESRSQALDHLTGTNQTVEVPVQVAWQGVDGKMWTAIIKPLDAAC